jgi:hypothetical protein
MKFKLTKHAQLVSARRGISLQWIEQVFDHPQLKEIDPVDSSVIRLFCEIPAFGGSVLRVAVNFQKNPPTIISVHFDRGKKGKI